MFNFNFLSDFPIKFFSSSREINPNTERLGKLDNLTVSNQFGKIEFSGRVEMSNLNYKEAIKIKKNEIIFSEEFINQNINYFLNNNSLKVSLYKIENISNHTKEIDQYITSNYVSFI